MDAAERGRFRFVTNAFVWVVAGTRATRIFGAFTTIVAGEAKTAYAQGSARVMDRDHTFSFDAWRIAFRLITERAFPIVKTIARVGLIYA